MRLNTISTGTCSERLSPYFVGYILGIPTILPSAFPDALSGAPTPHPITLFAALYTGSGGTGTWRPVQTITPLANAVFPSDAITNPYNYLPTSSLVLQIDPGPDPDNPDYSALVTAIIDGTHDDDTVVLCWESNALPVMLVDVDEGITGHAPTTTYSLTEDPTFQATFKGTYPKYTYPGKPEEELFNYVFVIIYHDDGGTLRPEFSVLQNPPRSTSGFNNVGGASISQYGFP